MRFGHRLKRHFYVRQNFPQWPPPLAQQTAPLNPLPNLGYGTANTVLLVFSCLPMILVDLCARRDYRPGARMGLIICLLCGVGAIVLRSFEFSAVKFRWDSNAYGSVVWFMLVMKNFQHMGRCRLDSIAAKDLSGKGTALPPDVRRWLCPADHDACYLGCAPGSGFAPWIKDVVEPDERFMKGPSPNPGGTAQIFLAADRRGIATAAKSTRAAKP